MGGLIVDPYSHQERGIARGSLLLSGLLAFGIFLQVLYLTKDFGLRADLTQDQLYSLSDSTKKVLDKLDKKLVIEAYFSADVPGVYQMDRQKIVDLLDEYSQLGGSKCQVVFYDPLEDEAIRERAQRLGIQEAQATDVQDDSIRAVRFYQGVRLRYGGDEQKVLPLVQNVATIEGEITPKIRELVSAAKPKVGILKRAAPPANPMMQQQSPDYTLIRRQIEDRFEVVDIDLSKGQLLADDMALVIVVAPKDLTDWEKYQIDQHVMRGKSLIVLQEAAEYSLAGMYDSYRRQPFIVDTVDSKVSWEQQLGTYGAQISNQVVADLNRQVGMLAIEVERGAGGTQAARQAYMPYWYQVLPVEWKQVAGNIAKDAAEAEKLAKTLGVGVDVKHPTLDGSRGVTVFWPTKIDLKAPLPEGVEGQILLRSSPLSIVEAPAMSTVPTEVMRGLRARIGSERTQAPLAVVLSGKFSSAWKGQELPKRPTPEANPDEKGGGLLTNDPAPRAAEQDGAPQEGAKKVDGLGEGKSDTPVIEVPSEDNKAQDGAQPIGPPIPAQVPNPDEPKKEEAEPLPERIDVAKEAGRVVVIGDASFVRDDFLQGLPPFGLTRSVGAIQFLENTIDWLALDADLVALRNKRESDRTLTFVEPSIDGKETQDQINARVASAKKFYRWLNIFLPVVALLGVGLLLFAKRSSEKRRFLAATPR